MNIHGRIKARLAIALCAMLALAIAPVAAHADTATKHNLKMYKVEKQLTLTEGQNVQTTDSCHPGDIATDGMWRIDSVDQFNSQLVDPGTAPWDMASGVSVRQAQSTSISTYTFRFRNNTEGNAQLHYWVTCLGRYTTTVGGHRHRIRVTGTPYRSYEWAGDFDAVSDSSDPVNGYADAACGPKDIFVAPSWVITTGEAEIGASYPSSSNLNAWTFKFRTSSPTSITVGVRCLSLTTDTAVPAVPAAHTHKIFARRKTTEDPSSPFNKGSGLFEHQISCGQQEKGLVGGYDVYGFSHFLGMDPRIKARDFLTLGGPGGRFYLVCFNDRTGAPNYS